jgi:CDP-paratose 2-epimerase
MNILISGAAGLVGFNACKYYAERGHSVIGMDNLERSKLLGHDVSDVRQKFNWDQLDTKYGVRTIFGDVSKQEHIRMLPTNWCDAIIHLAGQCGVPTSIADPRRDFEINTCGTFNILEYARAERNRGRNTRVAFASTNKVYNLHAGWMLQGERWRWTSEAWHRNGFPADMTSSLLKGSRTPYGNSKFMADAMMQEWYHMYGVPTGCFRMSCIYGPNQMGFEEQGWATWFIIAALKDLPITIYGDGKQVRDMLYVEDLVKAYDAFLTSTKVNHGVWNTGGGVCMTLSLNDCLDFLRKETGKPIPVEFKDWRPSDQRVYTSDITNLNHDLHWKPTVKPEDGLRKTMEWVKANLEVF